MAKLSGLEKRLSTIDTSTGSQASTKRVTGRRLTRSRGRIALRDGYTCQKCGQVVAIFEIDHVIPLFQGGSDSDSNKQLLCCSCHKEKSLEEIKGGG